MCNFDEQYFFSNTQRVRLSKKIGVDNIVQTAVNQLYDDRKLSKAVNKKMFAATYEPLKAAVNEGVGKVSMEVQFGTPNYEFLKQLQTNTAVLSAFKNHAQIKEMASLLKDESGNLRSKADFRKAAMAVNEKYNGRYLDTEYDTAVRQSRSAAQWQKALTTAKLYPNIKYLPSVAAHPRVSHEKYYGIIRPMTDPIWSSILPINSWGCKCGWEVTDEEPNDLPDNLPTPEAGFDFNPGATGQVFDLENSSYIKSVPSKEQPALIRMAKSYVIADMAEAAPYVEMYKSKAGTKVTAHPLAQQDKYFQENINAARSMANSRNIDVKEIKLLPVVSDAALRQKLLPGAKESKNPDFQIDGEYYELKELKAGKSKNTVKHALDSARGQADNAILIVPDGFPFTEQEITTTIKDKTLKKEMKGFGNIWMYINGNWVANPHK